jgi:hypothetical protein
MQSYPLDIDPRQLVRWIKAEYAAVPSTFRVTAARTREVREIPARRETHLGDQEREDLTEIATIATLEIAPINASDGWLLRVVVEDEAGPRVSDGDEGSEGEQRIDVGTFYNEFIRTERGVANVIAEVEGPVAKARVTRLIHMIEKNLHKHRGSSKAT